MAPTFYHSWPESVDMKEEKEAFWGRRVPLLWMLVMLLVVICLAVAVGIFASRANSEACLEGLRAEKQCRNSTRLLEHQLSGTQHRLLASENQASTCNHTVVSLTKSLEATKTETLSQQMRIQELQGETETLKKKLHDALMEVEQLRRQASSLKAKQAHSTGSRASDQLLEKVALLGLCWTAANLYF